MQITAQARTEYLETLQNIAHCCCLQQIQRVLWPAWMLQALG